MNRRLNTALLLSGTLLFATPTFATDDGHHRDGHHDKGHMMKEGHKDMQSGHHGDKPHGEKHKAGHKKKEGHHLSPHWAKTLNDQQRVAIDRMHLTLDTEHAVLKAKAQVLQKEINVMTAKDNANQKAIHAGIDELMALKAKIMKLRYDHLTEMREILNEQQRISYDMAILKREGAK